MFNCERYSKADAIICTYGNAVISELPIIYNGETLTFGPNIAAGVYKLFSIFTPQTNAPTRNIIIASNTSHAPGEDTFM